MEGKKKRIRYPKKVQVKQEEQREEPKHFILNVNDSAAASKSKIGS